MDMLEKMNVTIEYIEEHLLEESALITGLGVCLIVSVQRIWKRIYSEQLPNSGYEHAMLPEIEYYSAGDMMAADYKSEIWIPVKEK